MARSKLYVVGPYGRRPFMRGILVQSLVSRGIPFDLALRTATSLRDELVDRGEVQVQELDKLVERSLPDSHVLDSWPARAPEEPPTVLGAGTESPFSKGILMVSLEGAGLDRHDAFDVAMQVEARLLREGQARIERSALRELVALTIEQTHGPTAAERFVVWRAAAQDPLPVILLIGGATGAGKTSIAVEVARRLEIPHVIGTDSIRQIMRLMFSPELMPEIYGSTFDVGAEWLPPAQSEESLISGYRSQASKIAVGVHALLNRSLEESASLIIEGAHLLPGMVDLEPYQGRAHIIFLVVGTLDPDAYRHRFGTRAAQARSRLAERYLERLQDILAIQEHVLAEADRADLPIIDNVHFDAAVLSVIRSVISTLKKSAAPPVG